METVTLDYRFDEPLEAEKLIRVWRESYGNKPMPTFYIDRVEIDPIYGDRMILYLKLKEKEN